MPSGQRPTLQDIARKADVSVACVSYALNGKGRISLPLRKKLEGMLRDAGLKPRMRRHPVLYVYRHRKMSDIQAYRPLIEKYTGLSEVLNLHQQALRLELIQEESAVSLDEQLDMLLESRPGAVVLDSDLDEMLLPASRFFAMHQVQVIQIGHTFTPVDCEAAVVVDTFGGGQLAADYLIHKGYERIGVIRWRPEDDPASAEKFAGFTCAMQRAKRELKPEYVVMTLEKNTLNQPLPGRDAALKLLELAEPPTAIFVENSFVSPSLIYPNDFEDRSTWQRLRRIEMLHFEAWHLDWMEAALSQKLRFPQRETMLLRVDWRQLGRLAAERLVVQFEGLGQQSQVVRLMPRLYAAKNHKTAPVDTKTIVSGIG